MNTQTHSTGDNTINRDPWNDLEGSIVLGVGNMLVAARDDYRLPENRKKLMAMMRRQRTETMGVIQN